jgi:hypothetical protein
MTTHTITHPDAFVIETVRGQRTVHGMGSAVMVRNFEQAKGGEVVIVPATLHFDLTHLDDYFVKVIADPDVLFGIETKPEPMFPFHLDRGLQQSLYGGERRADWSTEVKADTLSLDHDFEQAELDAMATGQAIHDDIAIHILDDAVEHARKEGAVTRESRRAELEVLGSKALRPIASGLGVKGARIMVKAEMIDKILDAEF